MSSPIPDLPAVPDSSPPEMPRQDSIITSSKEILNGIRIIMVLDQVARPVMQRVFSLGTPNKLPSEDLRQYLARERAISNSQYRNSFSRTLRENIEGDTSCTNLDISSCYVAIQLGCEGLAHPQDNSAWVDALDSLENHLKKIKDARNDINHRPLSLTDTEFTEKVEELRIILVETLELAREKYNADVTETSELINNLNDDINEIRDNTPLTKKLQIILMDKGVKDLKDLFKKVSCVHPSTLAGKHITLKVDPIFTELEVVKPKDGDDSENETIDYTDLLQCAHEAMEEDKDSLGQILLIEGIAGVGKTTFLKLLLSGWSSGDTLIKGLDQYKLVIHSECRNNSISSLGDLLALQMPNARRSFPSKEHMKNVLLEFSLLIIIDGLDEMNAASKKLFLEIVSLRGIENLTIICTTRPEKVQDYFRMIPEGIHTFHVKIKGIPEQYMEKFLVKYHDQLIETGNSKQKTEALLNYFRTRGVWLTDHWRIPLNMTLLTLLWAVDPERVNSVTTAIELYEQIHKMTLENLIKRLIRHSKDITNEMRLRKNVDVFIAALCQEALIGLINDEIILKEEAVMGLKDLCAYLKLPSEDVLGSFLTQEHTAWYTCNISKFSFHHKGLQDFYASRLLFDHVIGSLMPAADILAETIVSDIAGSLSVHDLPPHLCHSIIKSACKKIKTYYQGGMVSSEIIKTILEHKYGLHPDHTILGKLQNVFILLIGHMYHSDSEFDKNLVTELIEILRDSGLKNDQGAWIRVLNSVKCNSQVAEQIAKLPKMFTKDMKVSDENVFAHATLLKVTCPKTIKIVLRSCPLYIPRLNELLQIITENKCHVERLELDFFFRHSSPSLENKPLEDCIVQLIERCKLVKYKGSITEKIILPKTVQDLFVSVSNARSYESLRIFFTQKPQLINLRICVNKKIAPACLHPLPGTYLLLYLPDVASQRDMVRAADMAKRLQPIDGTKKFSSILFPRSRLTPENQGNLIKKLWGVRVQWAVYFPSTDHLPSSEKKEYLRDLAKNSLGCTDGVIWGGYGIDEWKEQY